VRKKAFLIFIFLLGFLASQLRGSDSERKRLAYVSNLMSHSVSVIDLDSMKWLRDYSFGRYPIFSSLHPRDPAKMILALHNYERREEEDRLLLIDLKTGDIVKQATFPGAGLPSGFVYDKKRDRIYIADEELHKVFVLDGWTLESLYAYPAGLIPVHVDISPDCRWLAVTNRKSANLYVYDLDNIQRHAKDSIFTVQLGASPGLIWDADEAADTASSHPIDVKFGRDANLCYVTDFGTRELLFVNLQKREISDRVSFERAPFDMALDRRKERAYVCQVGGDKISVVDLAQKKVIAEVSGIAAGPIHCELDEQNGRLIAACWGNGQEGGIVIIDLKTCQILKKLVPPGAKASIGITLSAQEKGI